MSDARLAWVLALAVWGASASANGFSGADQASGLGATAKAAMARPSSLAIGRCALGPVAACFARVQAGLFPEDRGALTLEGDRVAVDVHHRSSSPNFQALSEIANGRDAVRIYFLSPSDSLTIRESTRFPSDTVDPVRLSMGSPKTDNGFSGYTFFQYRGKIEEGIVYSNGDYTVSVINTSGGPDEETVAFFHELRHVLLGDFGRHAANARHHLAAVDGSTAAAEREARQALAAGR